MVTHLFPSASAATWGLRACPGSPPAAPLAVLSNLHFVLHSASALPQTTDEETKKVTALSMSTSTDKDTIIRAAFSLPTEDRGSTVQSEVEVSEDRIQESIIFSFPLATILSTS